MARHFDGVDDLINAGTGASLANLDPLTVCGWLYFVDLGAQNYPRVLSKEAVLNEGIRIEVRRAATAGNIAFGRAQTTAQCYYNSVSSTIPFNAWRFVALQYRSSASPRMRIFVGTPTALATEVAYADTLDGTGTPVSDSAWPLRIGDSVDVIPWGGRLGYISYIGAFLTLAEIQSIQFGIIPAHLMSDVKGFWPLWGVATPEPDLSGNGNNGTVTGAVVADGPPVGVYGPR